MATPGLRAAGTAKRNVRRRPEGRGAQRRVL